MSFILDALRKSEAHRRAGETPRFDDDYSASTSLGRSDRFKLIRGALIAAILVTVVTAGVLVVRPDLLDRSAVVDAGDRFDETAQIQPLEPERSDFSPPAQPQVDESAPTSIAQSIEDDEVLEDAAESARSQEDRRRDRRTAPERTTAREAPQREHVVADQSQALAEIERQIQEQMNRQEEDPGPAVRTRAPAPATTREQESEPWRPDAAEYVRVWELPLAVRRNLPELKLTIHVFSPQQDTRFVLINGERYVPGDQIGTDTLLVDIRREGAVVDFREHRFLLEP